MNQSQGLVKAYKIEDAAGVGQYVAVVQGAADGGCKKPTAANAAGFLGATLEPQTRQGKGVAVGKGGILRMVANGAVTRGDRVAIASAAGDVASVEATVIHAPGAASVVNVIGIAETSADDKDIFPVWIAPCVVNIAVS